MQNTSQIVSEQKSKIENYWMNKLSGELEKSSFPYDYKLTVLAERVIKSVDFTIPEEMSSKLLKLVDNSEEELFKYLTTSLVILLDRYKYSGDGVLKNIILGIPVIKQKSEPVNTAVALRVQFDDNETFSNMLTTVGQSIDEAYDNQDYPLHVLLEWLHMLVSEDDFPLFDVAVLLENLHDKSYIQHIPVNMLFSFKKTGSYIEGVVDYNASLNQSSTVNKIIRHFLNLLQTILKNIEIPLPEIEVLTTEEKHQLLFQFNETRVDYPSEKTIHELFELQAREEPDSMAVVFGEQQLTFKALDERANRLADHLRSKGVGADTIVGVMVSRSLEMIVGLLAVLKAGGAYVPIDPGYPIERIKFYMEDSEAKILLTQLEIIRKFEHSDADIDAIDLFDDSVYSGDSAIPENVSTPDHLAYVIYTSGSTGKPKGVAIRHRNAVNFFKGMSDRIDFSPGKTILALTTVSFDIFLLETLLPVTIGLKVIVADEAQQKDPQLLKDALIRHRVNLLQATPSRLKLILSSGSNVECLKNIEEILVGGEPFPKDLFEHLKEIYRGRIIDVYGPTETTVWSTMKDLTGKREINIGTPIANTQIYIIDKHKRLQPVGVIGELYIGGDGVARGYLNRVELTDERFIENPFEEADDLDRPYKEIYQTGDLARWMPNGEIDFLGRIDHQVKIRGFRIETGEIETHINNQENIKEAVVMAREDPSGESYLCAYIVAEKSIDVQALENVLSKSLLDYMIPSYFVQIDEIPLTPNGKVDRKKLPDPRVTDRREGYVAPRNEVEEKLADIWSELLHIKKSVIGIDDHFFRLGGHSLKAAVMITMIHKALNVKMLMSEIFDLPTIRKLSEYLENAEKSKYSSIKLAEPKEYYIQTSAQKRLYFLDQMEKGSILYNLPLMDIHHSGTDREKLEEALKQLIERHESLRTSFHTVDGEAFQKIHDKVDFQVKYYRMSADGFIYPDNGAENKEEVIGRLLSEVVEQFVRPFDLSKAPLFRVGFIDIFGTMQVLLLDIHHIVSDGLSMVLIMDELWAFYDGKELPPLPVQYKDFAEWLAGEEQQEEILKQEAFWLKEFEGEVPLLNIPTDFPRPPRMTFEGDTIYFEIDKIETKQLNAIAQKQGQTLYMVLISVYNILLAKLSGLDEIVVGTVTAGRKHADVQKLIGMFVQTMAVRTFPEGDQSFKQYLKEVKEKVLGSLENQDYPFEQLAGKVAPRQDPSRNPLFDVVFNLENEADQTEYLLEALMLDTSNPYTFNMKKSKFDLSLIGLETAEGLRFSLEFKTDLFKEETVRRFAIYFKTIASFICADSDQKISKIEIIPEMEKNVILYGFNNTGSPYIKDKTIHELFEAQTSRKPSNIAVVGVRLAAYQRDISESLTYSQLNEKANQVARRLRAKGMKTDTLAAIMVEPSMEMMIGMMGILKAGGAFLPIKDGTPGDRVRYILGESGTKYLLTQRELLDGISFDGEIIELTDLDLYSGDTGNLELVNTSADLAYVIYTSGSTGKPKGVAVEHRNLANLCFWHNNYYLVTANDHATKYAGFGFDASVWEVYPYLIIGAAIYIVPEEIKLDIEALNRYYEDNRITITFLPTQVCEQFMTIENNSLRVMLTGGDKLKSFTKRDYRLFNNYGPTENTVVATSYCVHQLSNNIPIGKPLYNNQVYILDKNDKFLPIGIPGELCIGGDNVARGYLNNPELTHQKFIKNPFPPPSHQPKSPTLYRTGDLSRWLPDGNIEFWGRNDYQVKIRGYRIELGEIENQLLHLDEVKEAVVIAREDTPGQKYLCAYVVPKEIGSFGVEPIKEALGKNLPDYMIPSFFVQLEVIPLTANGKIDTRALPAPESKGETEYTAPTNETEEILAEVWAEVLGMEKVGIDHNFFEIGGDSIKTILISGRLLKRQLEANVNDFFSYPTIRRLAQHIKKSERVIDQGPVSGEVVLTPILKWYFEREFEEKHHFNHFVMLYRKNGFDSEIVKKVFTKIVQHHDALRMVYRGKGKDIIPVNRGIEQGNLFDWHNFDLKETGEHFEEEMYKKTHEINRQINLEDGPLVKLILFQTCEGEFLTICIHHAVVDGISWRIVMEDFETGYSQAMNEEEIKFQDKTDSFKDWAQKLKEYADSPDALKELKYWETIENSESKALVTDHKAGKGTRTIKNQGRAEMNLDKGKTTQLLSKVNKVYKTEINDILLTALGVAIREWSKDENKNVLINLEAHGREGIIEGIDFSRTVAWFTSQYPVLLEPGSKEEELSIQIQRVKEMLRRVPNKGIGHGILKYLTSPAKKSDIDFKLQPEISFNYLGQLSGSKDYKELDGKFHSGFEVSMSDKYNGGYALDIYGGVYDEELTLLFNFNREEYKNESVEDLVECYRLSLEKIIGHCVKEDSEISSSGMTPMEYHIKKDAENYMKQVESENWPNFADENDYRHILLTGGTGFLGAHLLSELLANTKATLYLPVRGANQEEAEERFRRKIVFYFGENFFKAHNERFVVMRADLGKERLGIDDAQYEKLCDTVDAVLHPAANVKHHGLYEELHKDNVMATEYLLELSMTGKKKDFHYVSTLDVGLGNIPGKDYVLYTEFSHDVGQEIDHIYLKSKFEAEKRVLAYREKGLNGSIYRVGNLIFDTETGKFQENIGDDYFYSIIGGAINLKMLTEDMEKMVFDMSFINYTAKSIVLLMNREHLKNETYHLLNPNELPMTDMAKYLEELGYRLNKVKKEDVDSYLSKFEGVEYEKIIEKLKLHSWIFEEREGTQTEFRMDRTINLLKKFDFEWPKTNKKFIEKMIAHCKEVGFL